MSAETTVILLTYNNPEGAKSVMRDFYRVHSHEIDKFVFISVDQTRDGIIFDEDTPVHMHIRPYRNLGFSKGMNTGFKLANTKYTLLANDDVRLLNPDWYTTARAHLDSKDVLAVNPFPALRTWDGGGSPVWYWDLPNNEGKYDWLKNKPYEEYTTEDYERLKKLLWAGDPPGTTMFWTLMKTEAREIVGLLEEEYWCGGEDYSYNRRIFLTCKNCNKRKYEHVDNKCGIDYRQVFEPYKILTCTHSLVHHESSVSKGKAVAAKEANGYDLVAKNKNVFNKKWATPECPNPDIYGKTGAFKPNGNWCTELDL